MSDDDPIEIVTRGELAELREAARHLRRLAGDAHRARAAEADARGPRLIFGVCRCGGGSAELADEAREAVHDFNRLVARWTDAEHRRDGAK